MGAWTPPEKDRYCYFSAIFKIQGGYSSLRKNGLLFLKIIPDFIRVVKKILFFYNGSPTINGLLIFFNSVKI